MLENSLTDIEPKSLAPLARTETEFFSNSLSPTINK